MCFVSFCLFITLPLFFHVKIIDMSFMIYRALAAVGRGAFISSYFHRDQSTTAGVAKFFTSGFCYEKNNKQNFLETTDFLRFL